jgi:hypothetical protein
VNSSKTDVLKLDTLGSAQMTSVTNTAMLTACAALVTAGCASKRALRDSSTVPADELSVTSDKPSEDDHSTQNRDLLYLDTESIDTNQGPFAPPTIEEQIRKAKGSVKRKGEYFPEIIASDDHDTLLSIEALFSAMRGLSGDPKRWFQQLGFSVSDQVLFLGNTSGSFLWVVATSDDISIGGRLFRTAPTIRLYQTLIKTISQGCARYTRETAPDGVLGMQRVTPEHQLATTIDFSCGPITVELHGVRGSNKCSLDLIRSSDSPLRKSTKEQLPK